MDKDLEAKKLYFSDKYMDVALCQAWEAGCEYGKKERALAEREKILKVAKDMLNEKTQMQGLRMWSAEVESFLIKLEQRLSGK